jgi:hypothetical protein
MRSKGEAKVFGFQFSANTGAFTVGRDSNPVMTHTARITRLGSENPGKESYHV